MTDLQCFVGEDFGEEPSPPGADHGNTKPSPLTTSSSPDDARRTPATTENDAPPNLSMLETRCDGLLQTKGLRAFEIDMW